MFSEGSAIASVGTDSDHLIAIIAKKTGAKTILDTQALIDILNTKHQFPDELRTIIWRYLLRLPMNESAFLTLAQQTLHPKVRLLPNRLPVRFSVISNRLVRLISELTYWHPPLAECDWLPALVFPFLQIYERDSLISFEIMTTIISNWCSEWLHFVPNPPITILSRIDRIAHDFGGDAPLSFAWPVLRSFFGEVATTHAALILLDNILSSRPVFLEYLVAAFALLPGEKRIDDHNVHRLIEKAKKMFHKDVENNPNTDDFHPLPKGFYPVMVIVQKSPMWREKELQRIRQEAEDTKHEMALSSEIDKEQAKINRQRKNWMNERAVLRQIEEEQMSEFRRKESETLQKENFKEQKLLEERREKIQKRRVNEENSLNEWRADCQKIQDEMKSVIEIRNKTWSNWLAIKEESAKLAHEEHDAEMSLLNKRENIQVSEFQQHNKIMSDHAKVEQDMLSRATARSQEIEEEKFEMRELIEKTRRKHAEDFRARQIQQKQNK